MQIDWMHYQSLGAMNAERYAATTIDSHRCRNIHFAAWARPVRIVCPPHTNAFRFTLICHLTGQTTVTAPCHGTQRNGTIQKKNAKRFCFDLHSFAPNASQNGNETIFRRSHTKTAAQTKVYRIPGHDITLELKAINALLRSVVSSTVSNRALFAFNPFTPVSPVSRAQSHLFNHPPINWQTTNCRLIEKKPHEFSCRRRKTPNSLVDLLLESLIKIHFFFICADMRLDDGNPTGAGKAHSHFAIHFKWLRAA